ncbi:MAG: peptidoglycan DD-metalloendopeptidase family protein [Candidatus Wallbacteria bacterium]|nr:peptidoglycan DD-metalloendopeptidase family protein [Candidatus Wallbacteria bacterium]
MKKFILILIVSLLLPGCQRSPRRNPRDLIKVTPSSKRTLTSTNNYHIVVKGDSLWQIAADNGYTLKELKEYNGITRAITVGQKIYFPPAEKKISADGKNAARADTSASEDHPAVLTGFSWPIEGPVVTGFGEKAGGTECHGLEISAPLNAAFKSCMDGEVIFTSQMENYGLVTIIKNAEDFYTLFYSYSNKQTVKKGDRVSRGQVIGVVGKRSAQDQNGILHFEFRKRDKAVNPTFYLPKKG